MKVKTADLIDLALDWAVAKSMGYEVILFDTLWRENGAQKGADTARIEEHLNWQPQRGKQVIVEVRHLQLDQRNPENTTPTRCARDIPSFSSDWSQGGPLIERETINVKSNLARMREHPEYNWLSDCPEKRICVSFNGPTPLIAAMRCFVASRLGDEIEIPDEFAKCG